MKETVRSVYKGVFSSAVGRPLGGIEQGLTRNKRQVNNVCDSCLIENGLIGS